MQNNNQSTSGAFMFKTIVLFSTLVSSMSAMANFSLAGNGKVVRCSADDNISVTLNAKRSAVKYMVEGETQGYRKVLKIVTDNKTYVSYVTDEGTLTLGDKGDSFLFTDENPIDVGGVDCE
jgi:hypothetical protein